MNAIVIANEIAQAELEAGPDVLAWNRLSEVTVPTVVGSGTLDLPELVTQSRTLATSLPRGEFVALDDVAHLPSVEAPHVLAQLIAGAIER
jgi:pimeloyl-ACP methyl ester carboxylesterase